MKIITTTLLLLLIAGGVLKAQNSYKALFASGLDDMLPDIAKGLGDEYNVIKWKNYWGGIYDTSTIFRADIYSFHNALADSARWPVNFNRPDTTIFPESILFDDSSYMVAGGAVIRTGGADTVLTRYQYIARFDINKQVLWEYLYPRPQELLQYGSPNLQRILKLKSGNYLTVSMLTKLDEPIEKWLIQSYTPDGDTIQTRIFSDYLAGRIESLTYNYDSSEILVHATNAHIPGCYHLETAGRGAVILDTVTYDTLGGVCYEPNFHIESPYEAMFSPSGNLVIAGETMIYDFDEHKFDEYFGVYVLDTNYNVINSTLLTDKDRKFRAGYFKCMDITANGDIYLAGILDRNPGFFPQTYDYIYLAKLDSALNLITERYFGGDAYYWVNSVVAATDGGMLLTGMQYDYRVNNYEYDAYVIKTDPDLWVNTPENTILTMHSALVYPNPGNGTMFVRTTERGSILKVYNLSGQEMQQKRIDNLITEVNCRRLTNGVYVWKLFKNNREIDHGKWIKIN